MSGDFLNDWNAIILFQISENDLKHPDYNFFHKALESYLHKLNVNVENMKMDIADNDFERLFDIRFCQYVDALYKISDLSNNFYYLDLTIPAPKKCAHVLKTLLNYLHYVEMVKKEVCESTDTMLDTYNDVLTEKTSLQTRNESAKQRSDTINKLLAESESKITPLREEVERLTVREKELTKECERLHEELKTSESLFMNLEMKENELQQQIVSDDEYERLCNTRELFRHEQNELKKITECNLSSNADADAHIAELKACCDKSKTIIEQCNVEPYEKLSVAESKIAGLKAECETKKLEDIELKKEVDKLGARVTENQTKSKESEKNLIKQTEDYKQLKQKLETQLKTLEITEEEKKIQQQKVNERFVEVSEMLEVVLKTYEKLFESMMRFVKPE